MLIKTLNRWLCRFILLLPLLLIPYMSLGDYAFIGIALVLLVLVRSRGYVAGYIFAAVMLYIVSIGYGERIASYMISAAVAVLFLLNLPVLLKPERLKDPVSLAWLSSGLVFSGYAVFIKVFGEAAQPHLWSVILVWCSGYVFLNLMKGDSEKTRKDALYIISAVIVLAAGGWAVSRGISAIAEKKVKEGRSDKAKTLYSIALSISKRNPAACGDLAQLLFSEGRYAEAKELITDYMSYGSAGQNMKRVYAEACMESGTLGDIPGAGILPVKGLGIRQNLEIIRFLENKFLFSEAIAQMKTAKPESDEDIIEEALFWYRIGYYRKARQMLEDYSSRSKYLRRVYKNCREKKKIGPEDERREFKKHRADDDLILVADRRGWVSEVEDWGKGKNTWKIVSDNRWYADITAAGREVIFFRVKGIRRFDVWPIIKVGVDEEEIRKIYVSSDHKQHYKIAMDFTPGPHRLWVELVNGMTHKYKKYRRDIYLDDVFKVKK
ncbi:MAG: tetratricopeptide repeat protein [Elusimicrobia bacterium]|nr:tetratricopeptide repeat protein [Elusimicrobiota bacterium]